MNCLASRRPSVRFWTVPKSEPIKIGGKQLHKPGLCHNHRRRALTTTIFWKNAVRNPYYKPTKTSTTVRIDSDVLRWLRSQGKGYQSRTNAILRREMLASLK
jgi:uncharacterized protein (DUF4415 family)